ASSASAGCGCEPAMMWRSKRRATGSSQRRQVLHEISLLVRGETELADAVVVRHDAGERCRAAVVKIRGVLPETAQRGASGQAFSSRETRGRSTPCRGCPVSAGKQNTTRRRAALA